MKLKKTLCLLMAATLALSLAACGGAASSAAAGGSAPAAAPSTPGSAPAATGTDEPVALNVALVADDVAVIEPMMAAFKEENPHIDVNFITVENNEYNDKVIVQLAGGQPIDVVFAGDNTAYASFIAKGVIRSVDEYITRDGVDMANYGPTYDGLKYEDGQLYQMPIRNSEWVLFYNKDLFDAAGVDYPKANMSYEEFRELAKQMTSGSGADKIYGAYIHTWPIAWERPAIQAGSTVLDKDLTPFAEALQFRLDMEADGSIMPYTEQIATSAHYRTEFLKGTLAMHVMGDFHVGQLRLAEENGELNFDWDIVSSPIPAGAAPNTTTGMPAGLCITNVSANPDAAWKFVSYVSGPQGAKAYAQAGYIPSYTDDDVRAIISYDGTTKPENISTLLEQKVYVEYPAIDRIGEVNTIFSEESSLVFAGEATPEQCIASITARIDELQLGQ